MKQTAVEWFEDQVGHNSLMALKEWNEIFEKAKEMEKEEMRAIFAMGMVNGINIDFEQFYKETYESNN